MIGLAFAVTDAVGSPLDCDFYGFEPIVVEVGDVATVLIDAAEPPLANEETLSAYHSFVESVAVSRACLPHRFGVLVDVDRVRGDMADHHDLLAQTLDVVRDRSEWLIRARLRDQDVDQLLAGLDEKPPTGDALSVGQWVHERVTARLTAEADALSQHLDPPHRSVAVQMSDDGLGFDLVTLVSNEHDDFPADIEEVCAPIGTYADIELFGPTPSYRYAAEAMSVLAAHD